MHVYELFLLVIALSIILFVITDDIKLLVITLVITIEYTRSEVHVPLREYKPHFFSFFFFYVYQTKIDIIINLALILRAINQRILPLTSYCLCEQVVTKGRVLHQSIEFQPVYSGSIRRESPFGSFSHISNNILLGLFLVRDRLLDIRVYILRAINQSSLVLYILQCYYYVYGLSHRAINYSSPYIQKCVLGIAMVNDRPAKLQLVYYRPINNESPFGSYVVIDIRYPIIVVDTLRAINQRNVDANVSLELTIVSTLLVVLTVVAILLIDNYVIYDQYVAVRAINKSIVLQPVYYDCVKYESPFGSFPYECNYYTEVVSLCGLLTKVVHMLPLSKIAYSNLVCVLRAINKSRCSKSTVVYESYYYNNSYSLLHTV